MASITGRGRSDQAGRWAATVKKKSHIDAFRLLPSSLQQIFVDVSLVELAAFINWCQHNALPDQDYTALHASWDQQEIEKECWILKDYRTLLVKSPQWAPLFALAPSEAALEFAPVASHTLRTALPDAI